MDDVGLNELTYRINGAVFEVFRVLGAGFLEKVYERALVVELKSIGIEASSQVPIKVMYKKEVVGEYFADLLVEGEIIIELKVFENIKKVHVAQILNYLKATNYKYGLLVNFMHPKATVKRYVV